MRQLDGSLSSPSRPAFLGSCVLHEAQDQSRPNDPGQQHCPSLAVPHSTLDVDLLSIRSVDTLQLGTCGQAARRNLSTVYSKLGTMLSSSVRRAALPAQFEFPRTIKPGALKKKQKSRQLITDRSLRSYACKATRYSTLFCPFPAAR